MATFQPTPEVPRENMPPPVERTTEAPVITERLEVMSDTDAKLTNLAKMIEKTQPNIPKYEALAA